MPKYNVDDEVTVTDPRDGKRVTGTVFLVQRRMAPGTEGLEYHISLPSGGAISVTEEAIADVE